MKLTKRILSDVAVILLTAISSTYTQQLNFGALDSAGQNIVHAGTGLEYAFVAGLGYSRTLRVLDRHLVVTGDLTLPYAEPDFSDYRLRAGVRAPIVGRKKVKLIGKLAPCVRGVENDLAQLTNIGLDAGLIGGYYRKRWFLASELGFDWAILTHIKHSDEYRSTIYTDAKDGWYAPTGGNCYYGLFGGYSFPRVDIVIRGGQNRGYKFQPNAIPLYANLSVNVRFGTRSRVAGSEL